MFNQIYIFLINLFFTMKKVFLFLVLAICFANFSFVKERKVKNLALEIAKFNNMEPPYVLKKGQLLSLPAYDGFYRYHEVLGNDDTLEKIASKLIEKKEAKETKIPWWFWPILVIVIIGGYKVLFLQEQERD